MLRFILRRCALVVPSLVGLLVVTFLLIRAVPSDPAMAMAGEAASPEQVAKLRQQYGFDRPIWEQFAVYVGKVARLDFGESAFSRRPVALDIAQRLPATLTLTFGALAISVFLGVPLGVIAAVNHNTWPDFALRVFSVLGVAVAAFWFAIMLQLLFSMQLGWLPLRGELTEAIPRPVKVTGFLLLDSLIAGRFDAFGNALLHLVLPAVTLALGGLATIVRFTRAGVLDALQSNFVLYQRAMGLPEWLIVWKYVLRNALISTVTQIGLLFGILMAGAVVVEAIFDWPGIGAYAFSSIYQSDYNAVMGFTLWAGSIFILVNLLVDLAQAMIDPRVKA